MLAEPARDGLSLDAGSVEPGFTLLDREPERFQNDHRVASQEHRGAVARPHERTRALARRDAGARRERRAREPLRLGVRVLHEDLPRSQLEPRAEVSRLRGRGRLEKEDDERDDERRPQDPEEQEHPQRDGPRRHLRFERLFGHDAPSCAGNGDDSLLKRRRIRRATQWKGSRRRRRLHRATKSPAQGSRQDPRPGRRPYSTGQTPSRGMLVQGGSCS